MVAVVKPEPDDGVITYGTLTPRLEVLLRKRFQQLVAMHDQTAVTHTESCAELPVARTRGSTTALLEPRLRLSHALLCVEAVGKLAGDVELALTLKTKGLTTSDFANEDQFVEVVRGVLALRYRLLSQVLSEAQFIQVMVMLSVKGELTTLRSSCVVCALFILLRIL